MKTIRFCLLLIAGLFLASCTEEPEEALRPVNLSLLIDQASVSGDLATTEISEQVVPGWREVFREEFTRQSWARWTPAPNQVPPPDKDPQLHARWQQAVEQLHDAARLVQSDQGADSGQVLEVKGAFDLQWVGYVVPVRVKGGRNYRISSRIKVDRAEVLNPERIGFVGFLELDTPLEAQGSYAADEIAPHILADQKSPGAGGVDSAWRDESFTLTLHEETKTLLLYLAVYHGDKMAYGRVLFDDVMVEELSVDPLGSYLAHEYLTPWTSKIEKRRELFKVAGWGNPTEFSHHLEGLVSTGDSRIVLPLDGRKYESFSFWYGPLREFSSLAEGQLSFHVEVNGRELFTDSYDFSRGDGRQGWRQKSVPLPDGVEELTLITRVSHVGETPVGFWGAPRLLPRVQQPQRSVLVICIDSLRKDFTGLYGGVNAMPVFDQLAKDGVVYDNYLSAGNTTRYALTALMTGQYAGRNGLSLGSVYDQLTTDFRKQFAERVATLQGLFRDHGYLTFASMDNPFFLPISTGLHMGSSETLNVGAAEGAYQVITDQTLDYLKSNRGQPVFAYVHYDTDYMSRLNFTENTKVDATQIKAAYFLELEKINAQIQRLLADLHENNLVDSMDIVLLSDHGESLDPGLPGHGYHLSPSQVVVPLVVKPAQSSSMATGLRSTGVLSSVDLAPWLATEHGLPLPAGFAGEGGAIAGAQSGERSLFSEGIKDHRLLLLKPQGTYLLHQDGREELFAEAKSPALLRKMRREAIEFLGTARPGLLFAVKGGDQEDPLQIDIKGAGQVQVVGLQPEDTVELLGERLTVSLLDGSSERVLIVPEEAINYPFKIMVNNYDRQLPVGSPPDFLPLEQGELSLSDSGQLYALSYPSPPDLSGEEAFARAWYSPGQGVRAVSKSAKLDPAMRTMLKRWGYLK